MHKVWEKMNFVRKEKIDRRRRTFGTCLGPRGMPAAQRTEAQHDELLQIVTDMMTHPVKNPHSAILATQHMSYTEPRKVALHGRER